MDILNQYLQLLWEQFQYDLSVFSQGWIYYWLLIPAIFYMIFFWIKWIVLTLPIWMPVRMAVAGIASIFRVFIPKKKKISN